MSEIELFFAPGSCSRVPAVCLFEANVNFTPRLVRFMKGEHRAPDYLARNPKGKVPTLIVDGEALTENVAILSYLAQRHPAAALLPLGDGAMSDARILADLAWCASGLHPIVTRIRLPFFFCDLDGAAARVHTMACAAMQPNFELIERRLQDRPWWFGETWSALDAYLFWVWFRVSGAGFEVTAYPNYAAHATRMQARDSVQRWTAVEAAAEQELASQGLQVKFPGATR
jgi:glutathione S-transferase